MDSVFLPLTATIEPQPAIVSLLPLADGHVGSSFAGKNLKYNTPRLWQVRVITAAIVLFELILAAPLLVLILV